MHKTVKTSPQASIDHTMLNKQVNKLSQMTKHPNKRFTNIDKRL